MKRVSTVLLTSVAVLLLISSCATVPKGPLGPGELRLLSMDVPENGNLFLTISYMITINFEADGNPEINRACFNWSGDGPYCVSVQARYVRYGSHPSFQILLYAQPGENRLECYAEYTREGKRQRTNTVDAHIMGYVR